MTISIEEQFKYHPPTTERRKQLHNECNELALNFAVFIDKFVKDELLKKSAISALQNARMLVNQGITIDELEFLDECKQNGIVEPVTTYVEKIDDTDLWDEPVEKSYSTTMLYGNDDEEPIVQKSVSSKIKQHLNKTKR